MTIYQVRDWELHFENDRSRQRDRCSFVCVPNKQHGIGFCRVVSEPDGSSIYGIWQMVLGACSQQHRPREGWLTDDGTKNGRPWGVGDLALKFRRPESEIQRAFAVLSSSQVSWLLVHTTELTADSPSTHRPLTTDSPGMERKERREWKEERNGMDESVRASHAVNSLSSIVKEINKRYKRSENQRWVYSEESALSEVSRRPEFESEAVLVFRFMDSIPENKKRWFPNSVSSLLSRWSEVLDRARTIFGTDSGDKKSAKSKPKRGSAEEWVNGPSMEQQIRAREKYENCHIINPKARASV